MLAKLSTPDLLKINTFSNKIYSVIISDHYVVSKFLFHVAKYIRNVVI